MLFEQEDPPGPSREGVIAMPVKPIPDTSARVIPMLVCRDPEAEIEFCERVLKAEVGVRRSGPDGKTVHAAH